MRPGVWALVAWLGLAAAVGPVVHWPARVPRGPSLHAIPREIGPWRSRRAALTPHQDMLAFGAANLYDEHLVRVYTRSGAPDLEVQVFYCGSRRPRNGLTNTLHKVNCLHGHYTSVERQAVDLAPGVRATRLRLARGARASTVVYWLQSPGRTSAQGFAHLVWQYARDARRARSDGCFVKIAYYGPPAAGHDQALTAFAAQMHGVVDAWLSERTLPGGDAEDTESPAGAGTGRAARGLH